MARRRGESSGRSIWGMRVSELSPREMELIKLAIAGRLMSKSGDEAQKALLDRGLLHPEGDHLVATLEGHCAYIRALPSVFD